MQENVGLCAFDLFSIFGNEVYARDTSKKIRAVFQSKGRSGEIICRFAPYRYLKDPDSKKHWLVDEEAAEVVRKIFDLYINGMGTYKIASLFEKIYRG